MSGKRWSVEPTNEKNNRKTTKKMVKMAEKEENEDSCFVIGFLLVRYRNA